MREVGGSPDHPEAGMNAQARGLLVTEVGQSLFLLGLMAAMVGAYLGLGLLAARLLG